LETGRARVGNRETGSERRRESVDGWSCETEKLRENDLLIAGWGAGRGWCLHESRSTLSRPIMRCGVLRLCPPPPSRYRGSSLEEEER